VAKGPHAFRTISEAAEELGVPQHVLRFWETKFSFIRPMKRAAAADSTGRRTSPCCAGAHHHRLPIES